MDILSYSHAYFGGGHNAGAETTLHDVMRLLSEDYSTTALVSKPHKDGSGPYLIDGVRVQPYTSKLDPELWFPRVDVILSHLECALRSSFISPKYNVPVGHLIHNDQSYCVTAAEKGASFLIFNTEWVQDAYCHIDVPSRVLHPIVDPDRYRVDSTREYITIINLSDGTEHGLSYDKGPRTFYEMARRFPDEKFLGVKGAYGHQMIEDLPNVTIVEHTNNILDVYRKTKLLLVPSKYESYGRAPVEAACSGIPSVVTDTQGLREAMDETVLFADFDDIDRWEHNIRWTLEFYDPAVKLAYRRADENWQRSQYEWTYFKALLEEVVDGSSNARGANRLPRI